MKLSVSQSQHSTVEFIIISQLRHEKDREAELINPIRKCVPKSPSCSQMLRAKTRVL